MQIRQFTRLTNGLSKKLEELNAAVSFHFCHYNFAHGTRACASPPAMAAGVSDSM
jgi:hypothetical protein